MVKSMTGFGRAEEVIKSKKITCEVKSLNSKSLDISQFRIPQAYKEKEYEIRTLLSNKLQRGKIDLYITVEEETETNAPQINKPVFESYLYQIHEISKDFKISLKNEPLVQSILRLPEVFKSTREEIDQEEWNLLFKCISTAIDNADNFREQEGKSTHDDLARKVKLIESNLESIEPWEKERITSIRNRISDNLSSISKDINVDKNRFEQELLYYIEKMDINEEKVRLANHCKFFIETMNEADSPGRKLGFIAQEMGREINTIGSKANHVQIQRVVVQMKDELEKIKEQLLNVL